ncbi:spore germination protein KB [Anaerovirgula multivorans]|uniref:Spore germination protein KB n=1 Tax=Anaerovirgula multivorans TaxID=312168 RepID=A0A239ISD7_9FIRM|nr:endospore germination permease [Anaerovirgula multivorans]SNS95334.1 spore germination protein KB [Anaerovirgula multivorans]
MQKTKITNHQLLSLTANGSIGGSVIVISATVASIAKQDAWIAALLTPVFGMPVIWIYWFLGSQYPDKTFVGIIKEIFGKWIGFIAAASFVFLCLQIAYHIPWYIGNFITTQAMPETPIYAINLLFVTALVIAIIYGIETIARASELFIYFASIIFFLAMILVSPNAKIENLQPVFENGIMPILKSSVFFSCFLTLPLITLMMIYPIHLSNMQKAKKSLFKGYLWANLIIFITTFMSILVLGSIITAKAQYPTYLLATEINVGVVFTRLEFLIVAIWIVTQFMIGILFFYSGVTGLSELIGLKEHKKIVVPLGLIILVMSEIVFPDAIYQANWVNLVWPPYIITYGLILPVILLLTFCIKKWIFKRVN